MLPRYLPQQRRPPEPSRNTSVDHLRGRISIVAPRGRDTSPLVVMQVVNTRTGRVLTSDNVSLHTIYGRNTGLEHMMKTCTEAVIAARASWHWGYKKGDLQ